VPHGALHEQQTRAPITVTHLHHPVRLPVTGIAPRLRHTVETYTRNKIVPVHTVPPAMRTEPSRPSPRLSARQLDLQLAYIMNSIGLPFGYALANLWIFLVPARPDPPLPGAVHGQAYSENNKPMHP
jgi:hypothetical protein